MKVYVLFCNDWVESKEPSYNSSKVREYSQEEKPIPSTPDPQALVHVEHP